MLTLKVFGLLYKELFVPAEWLFELLILVSRLLIAALLIVKGLQMRFKACLSSSSSFVIIALPK